MVPAGIHAAMEAELAAGGNELACMIGRMDQQATAAGTAVEASSMKPLLLYVHPVYVCAACTCPALQPCSAQTTAGCYKMWLDGHVMLLRQHVLLQVVQ